MASLLDRHIQMKIDSGLELSPADEARISANRGLSNRFKEVLGRRSAMTAFKQQQDEQAFQNTLRGQQKGLADELLGRYNAAQQGPSAQDLAGGEIERMRRNLGVGQEAQQRGLNRLLASRGSGNTASALFARQNAAQGQQDRLYDLEGQRTGLTEDFQNQYDTKRANLLSQYGNVVGGFSNPLQQMQLPGIDFSKQKSGLSKVAGGIGKGIGGLLGGVASAAGSAIGGGLFGKKPPIPGQSAQAGNIGYA